MQTHAVFCGTELIMDDHLGYSLQGSCFCWKNKAENF